MSSRIQISIVAGLLILLGLGLALYKKIELGFPLSPGERQSVWTMESKISFKPAVGPVDISLILPEPDAGWVILNDHFASSGFNFSVEQGESERQAKWTSDVLNTSTTLYYKLDVYHSGKFDLGSSPVPAIAVPELAVDQQVAMDRVVELLREQSSDVVSFTAVLLQQLVQENLDQDMAFLFAKRGNSNLSVIMNILANAAIPAQTIKGVFLEDGRRRQQMDTLIEVYAGGNWYVFNPKTAEQGLPNNFFIWQRGDRSVLNVFGGKSSQLEFAIVENTLPIKTILSMEQKSKHWLLLDFSIYSLPVEQQGVLKGLLLIPVGALVIVLLRVLVGLRTSGTFMPILIALAFIQTTLFTGLLIFLSVVSAGLWIRFYLSYLSLLLVARIAAGVIVVIFLMSALSIISYKFGFEQFLTVTFLPVVILAWTIERMSILWEEEGVREVFIQGGGSLLAAVLAYLLMSVELVKHLTFNFPELMISLLGVVLLLGKYNGYRLTELYRFREFGKSEL